MGVVNSVVAAPVKTTSNWKGIQFSFPDASMEEKSALPLC
jgi:hypothetical protein